MDGGCLAFQHRSRAKPLNSSVYFARPYDLREGTFGERLRFVKPTTFIGVPRVWEKIMEKLKAMAAAAKGPKFLLDLKDWSKEQAGKHCAACQMPSGGGEYPDRNPSYTELIMI